METGPRYPDMPRPQLSNCEHSDGRLLMTHAEAWTGSRLRRKGPLGASGSPEAAASTGSVRHLSGSLGLGRSRPNLQGRSGDLTGRTRAGGRETGAGRGRASDCPARARAYGDGAEREALGAP
ncbi:hypothetical protein J1605_002453 [Eschrichtius robustus]|uniref:Uncharacterized protein n=1 Tax=Eschrichtius robustus TaxID=9764 RepID=A0AB34HVI9_ESCRO|nr:hypothetical protein J1605_002453 [Eschrichtius robustus]